MIYFFHFTIYFLAGIFIQHTYAKKKFVKLIVCKLISVPLKTQIVSGSDSGTEHDHDTTKTNVDIPAQIFEILKSISTEIFVKEYTNHQVVTVIYVVHIFLYRHTYRFLKIATLKLFFYTDSFFVIFTKFYILSFLGICLSFGEMYETRSLFF